MNLLLFLAALPAIYWTGPVSSAAEVRSAGIERLLVPPDRLEEWRGEGLAVLPLLPSDRETREPLDPPGLLARPDVATPTLRPWVVANGWRFRRQPTGRFLYAALPPGRAALAAAEAFSYGADAVLTIDGESLVETGAMLRFLATIPDADLPEVTDVAVVDDGSALVGEVLSLLARRNILFRPVTAAVSDARLCVEIGTEDFPREQATDPDAFALAIRRRLTDDRRWLRVYGSEVTLVRVEADARRARIHLLNYGGRPVAALRLRLEGRWEGGSALGDSVGPMVLEDLSPSDAATEFTLPELRTYAVVDLTAER